MGLKSLNGTLHSSLVYWKNVRQNLEVRLNMLTYACRNRATPVPHGYVPLEGYLRMKGTDTVMHSTLKRRLQHPDLQNPDNSWGPGAAAPHTAAAAVLAAAALAASLAAAAAAAVTIDNYLI